MGLVRGYVYFENRSIEDLAVLKDASEFKEIQIYTAPFLERNGKAIKEPVAFFDGESRETSDYFIANSRRLLGLSEKIDERYPRCDLSTENEGDCIKLIKDGSLNGDYTGVRVILAKENGIERLIEEANKFANSKDVFNLFIRGVEKRADGKQKYCLDVITDKKMGEFVQIIDKSDRLRLQGRLNAIPFEYTRIYDLKRIR